MRSRSRRGATRPSSTESPSFYASVGTLIGRFAAQLRPTDARNRVARARVRARAGADLGWRPMDLPPWVNSAADGSDDPDDDTRRTLKAIERAVADLGERMDSLAATLESSVREAVAKDVEAVAADLRHTVSDLGRLLVRDLGRLSKILSEHRDTIVAEVRGRPSASPAEPKAAPPPVDIPQPEVTSIPVAQRRRD